MNGDALIGDEEIVVGCINHFFHGQITKASFFIRDADGNQNGEQDCRPYQGAQSFLFSSHEPISYRVMFSQFDPGKIAACIVDAIIIATHHRIIYGFVKLVKNLWGSPCVYNSMCDITGTLYPLNISVGTDGIVVES